MSDYALVPVEHQPDFGSVSLVPVDHDPFSDRDGIQQGPTQLARAQTPQVQQKLQAEPQRLTTYHVPIPGDVNAALPEAYQDPNVGLGAIIARAATNLATLPQRALEASAADAQHLGEDGYTPQSIGPAVETALLMAGTGLPMAERGAAGAFGGKLPASRAAEKGFPGIGTTPNGGPTFVGSDHLYPAGPGQRNVVKIPLTGSRRNDFDLANEEGGFSETPPGYRWHHVDDFDPKTGESSLELITKEAHQATYPHAGSVSQYEKFHGRTYKR